MSIRLSVIVPGYRTDSKLWRACIDSIRRACSPDDEIICVDDASPEPYRVSSFSGWQDIRCDCRVKLITRETNGGLSVARNTALQVARGRYVAFVDSDDQVKPDVFSASLARLEETGADIALFGVRFVWETIGLTRVALPPAEYWGKLKPQMVQSLSESCLLNFAWNKIYRTSFLRGENELGMQMEFHPEGMPCEDIVFNLACIRAGAKWCGVALEGYVYFRRDGTLLANYKKTNAIGLKAGSDAWKCYKDMTPGARDILGDRGELTDDDLVRLEWQNIWKPRSPFGLMKRWRFLKKHPQVFPSPISTFVKRLIYTWLRNHLYIRPVRRWHVKRLYSDVMDCTM